MNLSTHLSQLERAQLVRALDDQMMAYLFKHVLVQETTYGSLLKHDRQRLHRNVARTLESSEPERLDENAARLAQHFAEAGDDIKTLEYEMRAGDYAAGLYANAESIDHYARALTILMRHGGTAQEYLDVYLRRGRVLELAGEHERALENYQALEQEGRRQGDASLELAGLLARATIYATPTSVHQPAEGARLNARALELAQAMGDRRAECQTLWNLLLLAYFDGEPEAAVAYGERALALARELNLPEREAYILNDISRPLISVGPIQRSLDSLEQARVLFEAQKNLPMLVDNLAATSETLLMAGDYERGAQFTDQALALGRTINNFWSIAYSGFSLMLTNTARGNLKYVFDWTRELGAQSAAKESFMYIFGVRSWLPEAYYVLGDFPRAVALSREMEAWSQGVSLFSLGWIQANLVRHLIAVGDLTGAQDVSTRVHQLKLQDYSSMAPILVGVADMDLALALDNPARALQAGDTLLSRMERLGIHFYRAHIYHLRGKAYLMQAAMDDAVNAFERAREHGERLPARPLLWETYALWANVEQHRGNAELAQSLRVQARDYILYIADHSGSASGRETFLAQPAIQKLLHSFSDTNAS
jgi:tetratricopeptide (TPR) repeat protein